MIAWRTLLLVEFKSPGRKRKGRCEEEGYIRWGGVEAGHQMVQSATQHDMETVMNMNASLLFFR